MNPSSSPCALYLYPEQHDYSIEDVAQFITQLQDNGLISEAIPNVENSFYAGERFLDYIVYMGCSPAIQFETSENNDGFCHVKVHQYDTAKLIISQKQSRAPHCPNCNKPVKNWQDSKTVKTIHCDHCDTTANTGDFNWRKMAGYARVFIEITDIFPKEAIPQQTLLDKLTAICNTDWSYFYSCQ